MTEEPASDRLLTASAVTAMLPEKSPISPLMMHKKILDKMPTAAARVP